MTLGVKLALLILLLPIVILLSLSFGAFYLYKIEIDNTALISAVLIILLVWERLRDSLSKNLKYLHENVLFKLFSGFGPGYGLFSLHAQKEIKSLRLDLGRYGRFIGIIPLYPRKLLEKIDEFLSLHDSFYGNLQKISDLAEMKMEINPIMDLCYHLGFEEVYYSHPGPEREKQYIGKAKKLLKEQPELVNETKNLHENLKKTKKQIYEKLADFLKSNNLRLEVEAIHPGYNPYGQ